MPAKILDYAAGPITQPGIYLGVPMVAYHGQLTVTPSISSSGLRTIEAESCLHFYDGSYLNPDREEEDAPHFALGRAVHMLMLGEKGFNAEFAVRPELLGGKSWQGNRTECKQWIADRETEGRAVLTQADLETITGIARMLQEEPIIKQGLFSGMAEASMVWQDRETGVWLKARPDVFSMDLEFVADLKTIASADGRSCRRSITDLSYHMQLALIAEGYEELVGRALPNDSFILVFVEKKRPYAVNIKPVDAEAIWYGRRQNRRSIRKFAQCLETGVWPSYEDSGITAHLEGWLSNRLKAEAEAALLPEALSIKEAAE